MNREFQSENKGWLGWRRGVVLIIILTIIGFFLFTEHRAHFLGIFPYLLLLACPFMHFFMHRGHGGRDKHSSDSKGQY